MSPEAAFSGARLRATFALVVLGSVLLLAGCGGNDATGPPAGPSMASVAVRPDSTSLPRGGSATLTATVRDAQGNVLTDAAVSWSTSNAAVATVSSDGLVVALSAGSATITATSEGRSGSAVVVVEAGAFDLAIVGAQFTQGVQTEDGTIPMILQGDGAAVNVLLSASSSTALSMPLVLRLSDASTRSAVYADTATTNGTIGPDPDYGAPTVQFLVHSSLLRPGLTWQVTRDPGGAFPDDSAGNDVFPRGGPAPLATADVPTLKLRFVPIVLTAHGDARGDVSLANVDQYMRTVLSVLPLGRVQIEVGGPLTSAASFGSPPEGGDSGFWAQVVSELDAARVMDADASDAYWYGVVRPPPGFNYTDYGGWGYIPASVANTGPGSRTAVGVQVGWFNNPIQARDLVAHELGHTLGRRHAPCGGAANVDPLFPNAGGVIGSVGHDVFAWSTGLTSSAAPISWNTGDVMGYCHPVWASAYTYQGILDFRSDVVAAPRPVTTVLLVRGRVTDSGVHLDPAFTVEARPTPPESAGRYRLEGLAADGSVLFARSFDPAEIDHAPDIRTFGLAVPVTADVGERLQTLRVRGPAGEATTRRPQPEAPGMPSGPPTVVRSGGGMVRVTCAPPARGVLVRLAGGAVLGTAAGATASVAARPGTALVVACSEGVRTARFDVVAP